jgi:hypothetical protein
VKASDLARLLVLAADDLEHGRRRQAGVGVLRQAARMLVEVSAENEQLTKALGVEPDTSGCRECGGPVEQPKTGRPRDYCSTLCRRRARNARKRRMDA